MKCPECGSTEATQLVINLKDDDELNFYSCRKCEAKWWLHDGDEIALDEVLNLTSER